MTHPPRVVSSRVLWLITIVLSLTGTLAHATTCDVDADGDIDRKDHLAILADVGELASGPNNPRDADRNGRILSNDAQLCARRCTLALCAIPPNKAPIAKNDTATTALDTPVRINVIANDRDRDGRIVPSTVKIVTKPKHGKLTNHRDGTVTYSPALGFQGRDRFRYRVKDNRGAKSNIAKVTVTVPPGVPETNVPPVANNDSAATAVNTPVLINVVANDTDANGNLDPTTVAIVSNPANGAVVNNLNGTVTYTPSLGFIGTGSFTYTVNDTQGATSNVATVTVGVNAAPTADAGPDANAVTSQPVTLDGSGSSDPNGDMITFSWRFLSVPPASALADANIVNPTSPAPSFTPDVDGAYELELTVTDPGGLSGTDTVIITAATPNVAPNADAGLDQNAEVLTLVNLDGSGSSDPDNGPVTPLTFQWSFVSVPVGSGIDETDLQPDANSTQPSFTPDVIGLYRLTLTVSDGDLTDTDDVDINVALPNVAPNADAGLDIVVQLGPPAETATLDGTGSNDSDNGPVTPLTFQWTFVSVPSVPAPGSTLTNADIQNANTDTASFTPDVAGMYTLQLRVFDGLDEAFDQVMVKANAAPVAVDDAFDADEDTPLTVAAPGVLTNDTDANNDTLTAVLNTGPSNAAPGSFILNPDGSFDYTPAANFTGDDSFTYHANDGSVDSNVAATVTITVNPVANNPPSFTKGADQTVNEDAGAQTAPWATAIDDGDPAVTQALTFNVTNNNASLFSVAPSVSPIGALSYTPAANANGTAIVTVTLSDDGGTPANPNDDATSAPQTFNITVNAINDAPSFTASDPPTVLEDSGAQTVNWATFNAGAANESSQTVLGYTVSNVGNAALFSTQPAVANDGTLTYTPAADAFGTSTFQVAVQDDGGTANPGDDDTSDAQTFTITVTGVNDAPSFTPPADPAAVNEDSGLQGVTNFVTGISPGPGESGQTVSFVIDSNTNLGLVSGLSISATGALAYTPVANQNGAATITFHALDNGATANGGVNTSGQDSFIITVNAVNDPPVAQNKSASAQANMKIVGLGGNAGLLAGVTDADSGVNGCGPTFSVASITSNSGGTVSNVDLSAGTFDFDPNAGFTGTATVNYTVADNGCPGIATSAAATISITVNGPVIWFVQQGASGTNDGRLSNPFTSLGSVPAVDSANDRVFVFTGTYTDGLALLSGEQLIGQGVTGTTFDTFFVISPPAGTIARPAINGARPSVGGTVTLASNSTVRGLNIASSTATGLTDPVAAITGVTVSEASVTSTTGTAVNLSSTGGTVGLTSVSANGAVNGIVLNTTTGSFTVTGTGAAGTGGTIQNTTNRGASFISAQNVSLTNMNFTNTALTDLDGDNSGLSTGDNLTTNAAIHLETVFTATLNGIVINSSAEQGINGHNVKDFTLQNSSITNAGNGADEDGIHFYNMLGTSSITNTTISSSGDDNINVQNNTNAALPAGMTPVLNLTITNGSANTGVLGSGYLMGIRGTSTATVTIDGVTANNNFSGGVVIDTFDTATSTIEVKNSTITNNNDGISLSSNNGSTKFDIHDNASFVGTDFVRINILKAAFSTTGTLQGKIRNNPIVVTDGQAADGIFVFQAGGGTLAVSITGNTINYRGTQRAINLATGQDGAGALHVTATNNNIDVQLDGIGNAVNGILANSGVADPSGAGSFLCADIGGGVGLSNTFTHSLGGSLAGGDIRVRQRFSNNVQLPGYVGAATDTTAVGAYLDGRNAEVSPSTATFATGSFLGGAACTQPVFP